MDKNDCHQPHQRAHARGKHVDRFFTKFIVNYHLTLRITSHYFAAFFVALVSNWNQFGTMSITSHKLSGVFCLLSSWEQLLMNAAQAAVNTPATFGVCELRAELGRPVNFARLKI